MKMTSTIAWTIASLDLVELAAPCLGAEPTGPLSIVETRFHLYTQYQV